MSISTQGFDNLSRDLFETMSASTAAMVEVQNFVIRSTQQRVKNKIRNSPVSGRVYEINGITHQASAPGEAPADFTGALAGSYRARLMSETTAGYVYSDLPYAKTLEFGGFNEQGKYIEPRPHLAVSFFEAIQEVRVSSRLKSSFEARL